MAHRINTYGDQQIEVTVSRETLIERLKEYRIKHQQQYEKALALWRKDFAEAIAAINVNTLGEFPRTLTELSQNLPVNYLDQYDEAIDLFGMGQNETVKLEGKAFRRYCRDNWEWKDNKYFTQAIVILQHSH